MIQVKEKKGCSGHGTEDEIETGRRSSRRSLKKGRVPHSQSRPKPAKEILFWKKKMMMRKKEMRFCPKRMRCQTATIKVLQTLKIKMKWRKQSN